VPLHKKGGRIFSLYSLGREEKEEKRNLSNAMKRKRRGKGGGRKVRLREKYRD